MDATNGIRDRVATNVHSLMKQYGIQSQAKRAVKTGISQTQIGNILRRERAVSVDLLERLSDGLGCEPWVLLSPIDHVESFNNSDVQVMLHCYLRLSPNDQDAIKSMSQQLYDATRTSFLY